MQLTDKQRDSIKQAIAVVLGDAYDCTRAWSAWGVGTMGQDDFVPVVDQDSRLDEIVDAVLAALPDSKQKPVGVVSKDAPSGIALTLEGANLEVGAELFAYPPDIAARIRELEGQEPIGYQVWWGLMNKVPHWPPFKTKDEALKRAAEIKSNTEVRPIYAAPARNLRVIELEAKHAALEEEYSKQGSTASGMLAYRDGIIDGLRSQLADLQDESAWVRNKLKLPEDTKLLSGEVTLAGTLHCLVSHANGYLKYIETEKCDNKAGEIARQFVLITELEQRLTAALALLDAETQIEAEFNLRALKGKLSGVRTAIEKVCCDPEGKVCCFDKPADNAVLQAALDSIGE